MITKNPQKNNIKIIKSNLNDVLQEAKHTEHKLLNNDLIIKLQKCGFQKEASSVNNCSSYLKFSVQEHQQTKEQKRRLKDSNFCKWRLCATCNWRRNININKELLSAFESIEATRSVSYLFLTLTIDNPKTSDLKTTVKLMNEAFKRMSETKAYKNVVIGHFKALELLGDNTPAGVVHPHFHIILIVSSSYFKSPKYIQIENWVSMWQKALRVEYSPIVHIQKIKAKRTRNGKKLTALQSAVFEVAKYSVKHTDLTKKFDKEFIQIINQTFKMRFFSTGGLLKKMINFQKCDEEFIQAKEDLEKLWIEIYEEIYNWQNGDYKLTEIKKNSTNI
jgi:plasmid rolling circle replication initiator protein Rep